jgi:YidC/Oxa1 family membrane protein insertase
MDRNTLIGLLLIGALLIGYSLLNKPARERQRQEAQRIQDSIANVQKLEAERLDSIQAEAARQEQITTEQEDISPGEPQKPQDLRDLYGDFAGAATGEKKLITLENDLIRLKISTIGGRPYSVELKNYKTYDSLPLILFDGDSTVFGFTFFARNRSINTNELFFVPSRDESEIISGSQPETLSMRLYAGEDKYIEYIYTVSPGEYLVDFDMQFMNMNEILSSVTDYLDFNWEMYVPGFELGRVNELNYTTILLRHYQDEVERFNPRSKKDVMEKDIPTRVQWIASKQQFFSSVFIAEEYFTNAYLISTKLDESNRFLKTFAANIGIPFEQKPDQTLQLALYFGPNHVTTLKKYGNELEELVNLGGLLSRFISRYLIIPIFNFLNRFIRNYGLIILLLTIIIKVILFPLTYRSYLSMAKMKILKPEIDKINEKIPKEKAMERQQATMALYKKAGVSPMGGCIPMLLQMPILLAMFRFFPTSIELRQEKFLWAKDLSTYDSILDLPFNIPMYGDHVSLFTLLMTASTLLTMRLSSQTTASSQQMPGMKGMMYIMPIMFMFILNNFSAALTYYYFLANIITFGQNYIFKQFVDEESLHRKMQENKIKAPKKKSGFQKRLEEMAKKRGYRSPKK